MGNIEQCGVTRRTKAGSVKTRAVPNMGFQYSAEY